MKIHVPKVKTRESEAIEVQLSKILADAKREGTSFTTEITHIKRDDLEGYDFNYNSKTLGKISLFIPTEDGYSAYDAIIAEIQKIVMEYIFGKVDKESEGKLGMGMLSDMMKAGIPLKDTGEALTGAQGLVLNDAKEKIEVFLNQYKDMESIPKEDLNAFIEDL